MNLYLRLIIVVLRALKRSPITELDLSNEIHTRVMPNDLDLNFHMNNGRYLTICDFNRVDLFIRSGLAKLIFKNGWTPVIAEHSMKYIRPLNVFDKIKVTLHITHWDAKHFYGEHRFYRNNQLVAEGFSKSLIVGKGGRLEPGMVLEKIDQYRNSR